MDRFLERAMNVAIIVACVAIAMSAASRLYPAAPVPAVPRAGYEPGDSIGDIPGVEWGASERTLLVVVRSTCRFCTESMDFYRRLTSGSRVSKLVGVGTEPPETLRDYFSSHDVPIDVVSVPEGIMRVTGTPTLILVDRRGTVERVWLGRIDPRQEQQVIAALSVGS